MTAGHCTAGVTAPVIVWNSPRVMGFPPASAGRAYTSPEFSPDDRRPQHRRPRRCAAEFGPPIVLPEYGRLPASGYLDSFSKQKGQQDLDVTVVGYGLQSLVGPAFERVTRERPDPERQLEQRSWLRAPDVELPRERNRRERYVPRRLGRTDSLRRLQSRHRREFVGAERKLHRERLLVPHRHSVCAGVPRAVRSAAVTR